MKLYFCIATVAIIFQIASTAPVHDWTGQCEKETGIPKEILEKFRNHEKVEDPILKKYILCIGKKTGGINESGDFLPDVLKAEFKKRFGDLKEIDEAVDKCAVKKETPEQSAYDAYYCFIENIPGYGKH